MDKMMVKDVGFCKAESLIINSVGQRPVVFGKNPVRDLILVERAFSQAKQACRRYAILFYLFAHISRTYGTLLEFSSFFYQYFVPNGTCSRHLTNPVFYDKKNVSCANFALDTIFNSYGVATVAKFATVRSNANLKNIK